MTKYCYLHEKKEAFKECEACGKNICHDCAEEYWNTNAISSMFMPKKTDEQKLILCKKCIKKARIKNGLISSFLLIMVLTFIVVTIIFMSTSS